jgi:hydrogenase-4 component B
MPWTAACFALGAAAVSALPPLNGFVSEWLVYLGLLEAVTARGPSAWAAMPALIFLGVTGALALATFVKAGSVVFLGAPRTAPARRAHESGRWMLGPMLVLALSCTAIGLAPGFFWPAIARACTAWHPAWAAGVAGPLTTLGSLASGAALLWFAVRRRGLRRAPTWDCGYAAPSPRMQYSSGSFAGIAGGWFAWVLLPVRRIRRPRSPFPGAAILLERLPETVLERAIDPAARAILHVSTAVRRLQHGRLQYYIAYIVVGLSALGTLVAFRTRS